jgi:hypothetical protein
MSMPAINPAEPEYAARLGPLAPLMANPHVSEVMVVAGRDVYVEVNGRLTLTPITFTSEQEVLDVIRFIVESVGRPDCRTGRGFMQRFPRWRSTAPFSTFADSSADR